ncbi:MAG TPA: hypothetical protein VJ927_00080 [Actinomycetota bacterium]|nr:hypothetical protein [Actinomycetota bacterium]
MGADLSAGFLGAASFALPFWVLRRLPRRTKLLLWAYLLGGWLLVAAAAFWSGIVVGDDLGRFVVVFLYAQLFAFGLMIWWWQSDCLGDPRIRERDGHAQFEGRSRRTWELLLMISPWHVYRYRNHMAAEAQRNGRVP